jgi:hypothetical protein
MRILVGINHKIKKGYIFSQKSLNQLAMYKKKLRAASISQLANRVDA